MLTSVHRGPPPSVTCPNTTGAVAGERCRTGVNETETETGGWAALYGAARLRSDARERRSDLLGAQPGPGPGGSWRPAVQRVQVRARRPCQPRRVAVALWNDSRTTGQIECFGFPGG